jgi:hypothetical protein
MRTQFFHDDAVEQIAKSNLDAFFSDLKTDQQPGKFIVKSANGEKSVVFDEKQMEKASHALDIFEEDLQFVAVTGRTGPSPRLRSERPESEEWRPGDPIDKGLNEDDGGPLEKISGDRKREALRSWFSGQLAIGKTAQELVEYAERHDPHTAATLRALAAE